MSDYGEQSLINYFKIYCMKAMAKKIEKPTCIRGNGLGKTKKILNQCVT